MKFHAIRLKGGVDLKQAVSDFAIQEQIQSGVVVSAVGALTQARLRMAGATPDSQDIRTYNDKFEIVSLIGTVAKGGKLHLHMSIADREGKVIGGHLKDGCIVGITTELVIAEDENLVFERQLDSETDFDELRINS